MNKNISAQFDRESFQNFYILTKCFTEMVKNSKDSPKFLIILQSRLLGLMEESLEEQSIMVFKCLSLNRQDIMNKIIRLNHE